MYRKKSLILLIVSLIVLLNIPKINAQNFYQKYDPTPLDSFLVANTDTVIIFNYVNTSGLHRFVNIYLTRKKDTITLFRYSMPYQLGTLMPKAIEKAITKLNPRTGTYPGNIELNKYFTPLYIPRNDAKELWTNVIDLKPLEMLDDSKANNACNKPEAIIYDAAGIRFTMLTKDEVKHFYFYAPAHYEQFCPGNQSRKTILAIKDLISEYVDPTTAYFY